MTCMASASMRRVGVAGDGKDCRPDWLQGIHDPHETGKGVSRFFV